MAAFTCEDSSQLCSAPDLKVQSLPIMGPFTDQTLGTTILSPQPDPQVYQVWGGYLFSDGDAGLGSMPLLHPIDSGRDPMSESRREKVIVLIFQKERGGILLVNK